MIEVFRVVENQANLTSYRATQNQEKAIQLEMLIDLTKPPMRTQEWHDLIATPFRYDLPVPSDCQARFRPPYFSKNVFYSSSALETAIYEYSYHFMRQRVHLQVGKRRVKNETGIRTGFSADANDSSMIRVHSHSNAATLLHRSDYSASHAFVQSHPEVEMISYPSVRDPQHRDNLAIFEITLLEREINGERQLRFFYDYRKKMVSWMDVKLSIDWEQVV